MATPRKPARKDIPKRRAKARARTAPDAPRTAVLAPRPARGTPLVERLRAICLALPEANERISHGEPTWFAGKGKVFAMLDNHHHGAQHLAVWLPQPLGVQEALISANSALFFRPPYVGSSGWVGMRLDARPDWAQVARLVRDAYVHVATRKLLHQLRGAV
jgi:predicted DNA-binding protein (MmcQ/YjbR family)